MRARFAHFVVGQYQLELLERTNLFLTPLDADRTWYHYHPLFAEFLQKRLSQSTPELIEGKIAEQEVEAPPISILTEITYLAQIRALIAHAYYDAALSMLRKLLQHAEDERRTGSIISITVLQAKAFSARGDLAGAFKAIQRALSLAAPERYIRVFIDEGKPIKAILQHAVAHGIQSPYVMQLLHAFPEAASSTPHTQPLLDPLSERELEVLQCIMKGQSNSSCLL